MPVFRENVDFFFDKFIKVSIGEKNDPSVWAVGSYRGDYILSIVRVAIDVLTIDDIADAIVFVTLDDLMKFSPYWKYAPKALAEARKLASPDSDTL